VKPVDSTGALGQLAALSLVLLGLVCLAEAAIVLEGWIHRTPFFPPLRVTDGIGRLQLLFAGTVCVWFLVFLVAAVLFLVWLNQTSARQRRSGPPTSATTGATRVLRALSVLVPYLQLREVFAREGTRPGDRDPWLGPWLACVAVVVVIALVQMVIPGAGPQWPLTSGLFNALTCAREFFLAAGAFLTARLVLELERRRGRRVPSPG
jgi:hypothetical protein